MFELLSVGVGFENEKVVFKSFKITQKLSLLNN